MKTVHLLIKGRVQGVFFRVSTQMKAKSLKVKGWVRNLPSGEVEAVAQGEEGKVDELISYLKSSPGNAEVESVDVKPEKEQEFEKFIIKD